MGHTEENASVTYFLQGPYPDSPPWGAMGPGITHDELVKTELAMRQLLPVIRNGTEQKGDFATIGIEPAYAEYQASLHPFFRLGTVEENFKAAETKNKEVAQQEFRGSQKEAGLSDVLRGWPWVLLLILALVVVTRSQS